MTHRGFTYRLLRGQITGEIDTTVVQRIEDGACIPTDEENGDYREYLLWLSDGNTPEQPA